METFEKVSVSLYETWEKLLETNAELLKVLTRGNELDPELTGAVINDINKVQSVLDVTKRTAELIQKKQEVDAQFEPQFTVDPDAAAKAMNRGEYPWQV